MSKAKIKVTVPCPNCHGLGYLKINSGGVTEPYRCSVCKGTGKAKLL